MTTNLEQVHVIYRTLTNENGAILKITPLEYSSDLDDAQKYSRLFDLQIPADLKSKTRHQVFTAQHYS